MLKKKDISSLKKELIDKTRVEAIECIIFMLKKRPSEEDFMIFFEYMFNLANLNSVSGISEFIKKNYNLDYSDLVRARQLCLCYVKTLTVEMENLKKREKITYYLRKTLKREPTDKEIDKYINNKEFLRNNEPDFNEADCYAVYEASGKLKRYNEGRRDALNEAKLRYSRMSLYERFKSGNFSKPDWSQMENDQSLNADFFNSLYKKR